MLKLANVCLTAVLAASLAWSSSARAQSDAKPKDDALDNLLEKLEVKKPAEPAKSESKAAASDRSKPADPKRAGEVETKDKSLDNLLEKLGQTPETPAPEERKAGPGHGDAPAPDLPDKPNPGKVDPNAPKGEAKALDEHLEELTGRKRKKKDQGEGSGPLGQVIKEMREVEKRLGKTDTGEETRKKQAEIVKNLETLIEQLRNSPNQRGRMRLVMLPGQKAGQKPGETPGAQSGFAGKMRAEKPTDKHRNVGGKDAWGHLPPELQLEMENVTKEDALPNKEELIRLYYLSVSKKSSSRQE